MFREYGVEAGLPGFYIHKGSRSPWGDVFQIHQSGLEMVDQTKEELLSLAQGLSPSRPQPHSRAIRKLSGKAAVLRPPGTPMDWDTRS